MPAAEKWIGKTVYDCAGLVTMALNKHLGLKVTSGASSQWKDKNAWVIKSTINTLPQNRVVIVFRESPNANPMQHVGIYLGNGFTVDARGTSQGV